MLGTCLSYVTINWSFLLRSHSLRAPSFRTYDGHLPSLSLVEGWHAPRADRPVNPDLSRRTGRTEHPTVGAGNNPGTRPTIQVIRQPKRRQPLAGQAGTQDS